MTGEELRPRLVARLGRIKRHTVPLDRKVDLAVALHDRRGETLRSAATALGIGVGLAGYLRHVAGRVAADQRWEARAHLVPCPRCGGTGRVEPEEPPVVVVELGDEW